MRIEFFTSYSPTFRLDTAIILICRSLILQTVGSFQKLANQYRSQEYHIVITTCYRTIDKAFSSRVQLVLEKVEVATHCLDTIN